jgi:transcriptional regulator with XRE-family HTH domain
MPTIVTASSRTAFGRMLIDRRNALGLSREQVSVASDTPGTTYRRYERGINVPDFPSAVRIARALDISLDELASAL